MEEQERYEIIKLLGKGRTGGVYEADDTLLKRKVALRRFFSDQRENDVAEWEEEFTNISQNLCNLQNPGLITVFDAGVDEDGAFMITQIVDGTNLSDRLAESPLQPWEAHDLASQLMDTLYDCHEKGFIHGALTPGSIMMTERARGGHRYIILDLGLCRLAPLIQGSDSYLAMMADPALMAPELFDGSPATIRSDIYMLGQLIYTALVGGHPFAGIPLDEVGKKHATGELPPITDYLPDLNPDLVSWLQTLTQPNPDDRPETILKASETLPDVERPQPKITGPITKANTVKLNTGQVANKATATQPLAAATSKLKTGPQSQTSSQQLSSLTQSVSVTTARPVSIPAQASNKALIITLSCVGAAVVAIIIALLAASGGSPDQASASDASEEAKNGKPAPPRPTATFDTLYNLTDPSAPPSPTLLDFRGDASRDFVFITGSPVEDNLLFSNNGKVFQEIELSPGLKASETNPGKLTFKFNEKTFTPTTGLTTSDNQGLKKNLGYIVEAEAPSPKDGSFTINTFLTLNHATARIRFRTKNHGLIAETLVPQESPTELAPHRSLAISTTIAKLAEGEKFYIEILADKLHPDSLISLDALQCK